MQIEILLIINDKCFAFGSPMQKPIKATRHGTYPEIGTRHENRINVST